MGFETGYGTVLESDLSRVGLQQAGDDVKQGCLARAVGADDRFDLAGRDRE